MTIKYEYVHCGEVMVAYVQGVNRVDCALAFKATTIYDAVLSATVCK